MSIVAYAQMTNVREASPAKTSTTTAPPGVKTYMDALAALVPAEVLSLHAVILAVTTKNENGTTKITEGVLLACSFWGLVALAVILYVGPRLYAGKWDKWDWLRSIIPPLSFVGWAMLQPTTAFDAVCPELNQAARTVGALFLGVLLGLLASALAYQADKK